jgi:predicted acyltransferase
MNSALAPRFASVDALRGWAVAAMLLVNHPGDWGHVYPPLLHAPWNGATPTDLVFPLFLFVAGVSISLGLRPAAPSSRIWWRAFRLVALGLLLSALAMWAYDRSAFRPWGVLQRIGLCYGVAATVALRLRPRGQWCAVAMLLLGYWALLACTGGIAQWDNIASRVDAWMLGAHAYQFDPASGRGHDPEGLLSTLPAIATTLIGVRAGASLRDHGAARLLGAGVAALVIGWLWSRALPWNKNLWTPSYVAWEAGWSMLLLALCHHLFDVRGWRPFGRSMGINAITAYAGSWVMACLLERFGIFAALYRGVLQPAIGPLLGDKAASLAFAIALVAFWWWLVWAMAKRGIRVGI